MQSRKRARTQTPTGDRTNRGGGGTGNGREQHGRPQFNTRHGAPYRPHGQHRGGGAGNRPGAAGVPNHPFKANFNDHFATDYTAVRDLKPCLEAYRSLIRPNCPEAFSLYDPYYCDGSVARRWYSLGFTTVFHENRDFYKDIADGTVPQAYDILVTNPPFSDDHIQRLFGFLVQQRKPFAVLMPDYVATKGWYLDLIKQHFRPVDGSGSFHSTTTATAPPPSSNANVHQREKKKRKGKNRNGDGGDGVGTTTSTGTSGEYDEKLHRLIALGLVDPSELKKEEAPAQAHRQSGTAEAEAETERKGGEKAEGGTQKPKLGTSTGSGTLGVEPFYLVPQQRYQFEHPEGVGRSGGSHFKTMWYVWLGSRTGNVVCELQSQQPNRHALGDDGEVRYGEKETLAVCHGLDALARERHVPVAQRPNPQQRQQQREKRLFPSAVPEASRGRKGPVHHGGHGAHAQQHHRRR